eukprot:jgi/Mesvir1/14654/Mv05322-RA.1
MGAFLEGWDLPNIKGKQFRIKERLRGDTLEMWVPIPRGYRSDLVATIKEEEKTGYLAGPDNRATMAYLCLEKESPDALYLAWFYVRPRQFKADASDEEKEQFKGLGDRMLCHAIRKMRPGMARSARTSSTPLVLKLNASGGTCPDTKPYASLSVEDLRAKFAPFPRSRQLKDLKDAFRDGNAERLRMYWCELEQNRLLVNNYRKYGLSPYDERDGFQILMKGTLDDVERWCATERRPPAMTAAERDVLDRFSANRIAQRSEEDGEEATSRPGTSASHAKAGSTAARERAMARARAEREGMEGEDFVLKARRAARAQAERRGMEEEDLVLEARRAARARAERRGMEGEDRVLEAQRAARAEEGARKAAWEKHRAAVEASKLNNRALIAHLMDPANFDPDGRTARARRPPASAYVPGKTPEDLRNRRRAKERAKARKAGAGKGV